MKSKYLILSVMGCELPVVFSPIIDHSTIAGTNTVVSAGFCYRRRNGTYEVWGKSISLKKGSRLEDSEIISRTLEFNV